MKMINLSKVILISGCKKNVLIKKECINYFLHSLVILLFIGFTVFISPVSAQDFTNAGVEGYVYDASKNPPVPLPGVTVTFVNDETGIPIPTKTDSNGKYFRPGLPPGTYTVKYSKVGFEPAEQPYLLQAARTTQVVPPISLSLIINQAVAIQPSNPAGGATPTPTPSFEDPEEILGGRMDLQIRRGLNFSEKEVTNLPLGGETLVRSFDELALLAPGVAPPPQAIGNSVGPGVGPGVGTSGQFSVNGLRSRANNFMVDGSDNNDEDIGVRRQGFFSLIPQPIESVREFEIMTLLAPAIFGRNLGGIVNVISKSGGRAFHGSLYGFFNSDQLNARDNFDFVGKTAPFFLRGRQLNGNTVPVTINGNQVSVENTAGNKDSLTFLQGGGVFSGPIIKRKMFFFISAEGQLLNAMKETNFAVPTVEERGLLGTGAQGIFIEDEKGIQTSVPADVTGGFILGLFPFPNDPTGVYGPNTYTRVLPADARGRVVAGKYDYNFEVSGKTQFFTARYNYTDDWRDLQQVGGAVFSSIRPITRTDNFSTYLDGELTNNITNLLRFSWGRTELRFEERTYTEPYLRSINREFKNSDEKRFLLSGLGLFNATSPDEETGTTRTVEYRSASQGATIEDLLGPVGQVNISGFSPLGVDVFNFPQRRINNTFQIADTLFLRSGRHNFAFGTDIRRVFLESELPRNSRLLITSTGGFRSNNYRQMIPEDIVALRIPICSATSSNSFCVPQLISPIDLVAAGGVTGVFQSLAASEEDARANIELSYNQLNFFAQDDFRVSQKLLISYGLRYELNTVPKEADNKIERSFQAELLSGVSGLRNFIKGREKIFDLDSNNFAPRFGVAYELSPSTVIRGGYGIYYDQILGAVVSQSRNVFPTFSTVNFGAFPGTEAVTPIISPYALKLCPSNNLTCAESAKIPLIVDKTLNTLNPQISQQQIINLFGSLNPFGATIPVRNLDTPQSHQYYMGVEQELISNANSASKSAILSIAYVGTTGVNLLRFTSPNLGPNNIVRLNAVTLGLEPLLDVRGPARSTSNIGPIEQFETTGRSQYHSLQFQIRGRLNKDFQYQANYVYGRVKDDVSDVFDLAGAFALPQDSFTESGEYAPANFDVRHRFNYNFIYSLPFFRDENGALEYILGGWQVTGTGRFNTGQPFTVNTVYDVNQDGNLTDRLNNTQFIVVKGDRRQPLELTSRRPSDLQSMLAPIGTNGIIPRNSFRAGNILELDLSFMKRFTIRENQSLQFRADIFNFINRANFGVPVRILEFPSFGRAVDTVTPGRRIQFALKYEF